MPANTQHPFALRKGTSSLGVGNSVRRSRIIQWAQYRGRGPRSPPDCRSSEDLEPNVTREEYLSDGDSKRLSPVASNRRSFIRLVSGGFVGCACCSGLQYPPHAQARTALPYSEPPVDAASKVDLARNDQLDRTFAFAMANGMDAYEEGCRDVKERIFEELRSRLGSDATVVELGIGTGPNLQFYAQGMNVIGIEPNKYMDTYAQRAAAGSGAASLRLVRGVAEELPLADGSADAVVSTLTLCSVRQVPQALREVRRVLKQGGTFVFLEHVLAEDKPLLALQQIVLSPLQQALADGCHLDRRTLRDIKAAKFRSVEVQRFYNPNAGLISCTVAGTATL